ncbi:MAG: HNH endonuclease signature motif containing protein [Pseudomonadota bacterium]
MKQEHKNKIGAANRSRFTKSQDKHLLGRMVALYMDGKTLGEISAATGKPAMTVYRWVKNSGATMRKVGDKHRGRNWSAARRLHHPETPPRDPNAPRGYEILTQRALGSRTISTDGYVLIHVGRQKKQYEHILIAEKALGRPIPKGYVVHHINCNKQDNRPNNLLVCSHAYHLALHARMRRHPYWKQFH